MMGTRFAVVSDSTICLTISVHSVVTLHSRRVGKAPSFVMPLLGVRATPFLEFEVKKRRTQENEHKVKQKKGGFFCSCQDLVTVE